MKRILPLLLLLFSVTSFAQNYDIYVSDAGNFNNPPWQILKFDSSGNNPEVFINSNLNWPQDILFFEDSNTVLISNLGTNNIAKHDASTGQFLGHFATGISGPTRIKIGPDSLLYVLQWSGNGKVLRFDLQGNSLGAFTATGVNQSIGLDWDSDGNLYVSSYNGDLVQKFDTAGNDLGVFVNSNLQGPTNIWFDGNGDLLVSDYDGTSVKRFDKNGSYVNEFIVGLKNSEGVAYLPDGRILIGNGNSNSVKMFDASGKYIKDLIDSGAGNLLTPNAVVIRSKLSTALYALSTSSKNRLTKIGYTYSLNVKEIDKLDKFQLLTVEGKLILETSKQSINIEDQSPGMYIIRVFLKDGKSFNQQIER